MILQSHHHQCPKGSHGQLPLWIDITGCNSTECIVYDHKFVKMTGEMIAVADAKHLRMEVGAHIWGFRLSYKIPLNRFDACTMLPQGCPLQKGQHYSIVSAGYANLPFTGTTRVVEVRLHNEHGVLMLCGKSTLRFEKKKNSLSK